MTYSLQLLSLEPASRGLWRCVAPGLLEVLVGSGLFSSHLGEGSSSPARPFCCFASALGVCFSFSDVD